MATLPEAQAELVAALGIAGIATTDDLAGLAPPAAVVYLDGVDPAFIVTGQVSARFRVTLVAGAWDGGGAAGTLASLVSVALGALRALVGWEVGESGPAALVSLAGSRLLGVDLTASRMVTI